MNDKNNTLKRGASKLETKFSLLWRAASGPLLEPEFRFHPKRKWRADFKVVKLPVLIEIEGGVWCGGRHNTGAGFVKDAEKYFEAAILGYYVFRLTYKQLNDETIRRMIDFCRELQMEGCAA